MLLPVLAMLVQSGVGPPQDHVPPPHPLIHSPWIPEPGGEKRFNAQWDGTKWARHGEEHHIRIPAEAQVVTSNATEEHDVYVGTSVSSVSVPQYDGQISEVDMTGVVGFYEHLRWENLASESPNDVYWGSNSVCSGGSGVHSWHKLLITLSDLPTKLVDETFTFPDQEYHDCCGYDGTTDYGGTSGHTFTPNDYRDVDPAKRMTAPTNVNEFEGTGYVTCPVTRTSTVYFCDPWGNYQMQINLAVDADLYFTYTY